jgi:hypothetical protein
VGARAQQSALMLLLMELCLHLWQRINRAWIVIIVLLLAKELLLLGINVVANCNAIIHRVVLRLLLLAIVVVQGIAAAPKNLLV